MINIFYHPAYFKTKKVFVTKQFKYSIFNNLLIDLCYLFNIPMPNNFITAGPQQRFNHLIKSTKINNNFVFKKISIHILILSNSINMAKEYLMTY
jgi:hypothetical protein